MFKRSIGPMSFQLNNSNNAPKTAALHVGTDSCTIELNSLNPTHFLFSFYMY